jgi:hypothetical protein
MKNKIESLTIVCQQGTKTYSLECYYGGLLLDRIEDHSLHYPESFHSIYKGFTKGGALVFETRNAPTDVSWCAVK